MNIKEGYFIENEQRIKFKIWLTINNLSLNQFSKNCGCSRQYLSQVLSGKKKVTQIAIEHFKKGGYDLNNKE